MLLIIVFAIGIAASRGGMGELLELMFASMQGEIDKMFTPEVTAPQKATFDAEIGQIGDAAEVRRLRTGRWTHYLLEIGSDHPSFSDKSR